LQRLAPLEVGRLAPPEDYGGFARMRAEVYEELDE
jgi:hypothetical protein